MYQTEFFILNILDGKVKELTFGNYFSKKAKFTYNYFLRSLKTNKK